VADPANAPGVTDDGFTLLSLANNHSLDGGSQALLQTRALMRESGAATAGAGESIAVAREPALAHTSNGTLAVLAYASVFPRGYEARAQVPGLASMRAHTHFTSSGPTTAPALYRLSMTRASRSSTTSAAAEPYGRRDTT
jgi:poly-gamma-glutamate capsule biosynthesis protein CapA/YwtB (metallophosphatase superfamily)